LVSGVLFQSNPLTDTKTSYAQHNILTVTGRIFHAELVDKNDGFLAASVISTTQKDGPDVVFKFHDGDKIMNLHKKGYLAQGREVTITGHMVSTRSHYMKDGVAFPLKRSEIKLSEVSIITGGLGPSPRLEEQVDNDEAHMTDGEMVASGAKQEDIPF
tara:strand:- start:55 stop:528 length:474 start_codon:yes stop_codon:yes gene_type:complete